MKKIYCISAALALVFATVSCEKRVVETDFTPDETPMVPVTLTGSIPETRVSLDGVTPKWTAGDQLAVFTTDGTLCPAFTADQGGSSTTTFSGTKPDGSFLGFAIYPYSNSIAQSGSNYTLTLPATQDGTLGSAMMAAQVPAGEGEMVFSNLLTLVKVTIPSGISLKRIELQRSDRVSGSFTVNGSTLAVTPAASPAEADRSVVVEKASGLTGVVYLSVLPSTSKQIDLLLTRSDGKMALVSKTLETAYVAGHLKKATIPSGLTFCDVAKIGASTASQQYATTSQPSKPQMINGSFDDWHVNGSVTPYRWNSFYKAAGGYASFAYDSDNPQVAKSTDKRPGSTGQYSCMIWARRIKVDFLIHIDAVAQGNLTTGRINAGGTSATDYNQYNFTDIDGYATYASKRDTNYFYSPFTARPDSLSIWVKFVPHKSDTSHAKVQAILHTNKDYISGYYQNSPASQKVAEASDMTITTTYNSWKRLSIPYKYNLTSNPSFILVNISTNAFPGGGNADQGSKGGNNADKLYVDDIEMIYNLYNLRTNANGWATLYLNYATPVPSGVTAYYIKTVAGGFAELTAIPAGQVIPAHTGVLIKGSANTTYAFNGSAADIKNKTVATVTGNLLQGTTTAISKPAGTCRVLSSESTSSMAAFGAFTGSTIAANTAWLTQ